SINILSNQVFYNTSKEFIDLVVSNILDTDEKFNEKINSFADNIVALGWPLTFITIGLRKLKEIIYGKMTSEREFTVEQINKLMVDLDLWMNPINDQMIETYSATWERTVSYKKSHYKNYPHHLSQYSKKYLSCH